MYYIYKRQMCVYIYICIHTHIRRSHFLNCEEPCESVMIEGPHESRKRWRFAGFWYFAHFYKPSRQGRTKGFDRTTQRTTAPSFCTLQGNRHNHLYGKTCFILIFDVFSFLDLLLGLLFCSPENCFDSLIRRNRRVLCVAQKRVVLEKFKSQR